MGAGGGRLKGKNEKYRTLREAKIRSRKGPEKVDNSSSGQRDTDSAPLESDIGQNTNRESV